MSDESYSATLEIQNRKGLHARAAAAFVKAIEDLNAESSVSDKSSAAVRLWG